MKVLKRIRSILGVANNIFKNYFLPSATDQTLFQKEQGILEPKYMLQAYISYETNSISTSSLPISQQFCELRVGVKNVPLDGNFHEYASYDCRNCYYGTKERPFKCNIFSLRSLERKKRDETLRRVFCEPFASFQTSLGRGKALDCRMLSDNDHNCGLQNAFHVTDRC